MKRMEKTAFQTHVPDQLNPNTLHYARYFQGSREICKMYGKLDAAILLENRTPSEDLTLEIKVVVFNFI